MLTDGRGMDQMLRQIGIPLIGRHHSGLDDSRNIASILLELQNRWFASAPLSQPICPYFMKGRCNRGQRCDMKHMDAKQVRSVASVAAGGFRPPPIVSDSRASSSIVCASAASAAVLCVGSSAADISSAAASESSTKLSFAKAVTKPMAT